MADLGRLPNSGSVAGLGPAPRTSEAASTQASEEPPRNGPPRSEHTSGGGAAARTQAGPPTSSENASWSGGRTLICPGVMHASGTPILSCTRRRPDSDHEVGEHWLASAVVISTNCFCFGSSVRLMTPPNGISWNGSVDILSDAMALGTNASAAGVR